MSEITQTPMKTSDLDFDVTDNDAAFLAEFQTDWSQFLHQHPDLVPKGQREDRLQSLARQYEQETTSAAAVEIELKKQLQFFGSSRESLEDLFSQKMNQAMERQRALHDELQSRLDTVAVADQLQSKTMPWQHFLDQVDQYSATATSNEGSSDTASTGSRIAKPSARAMVLTTAEGDKQINGSIGSSDVQLRAYRTDHALLTTDIAMLQNEIERSSQTVQSQEVVGRFLTEHNVWSLLSSGNGSVSTKTGGQTTT
jgi:hypothetical protein